MYSFYTVFYSLYLYGMSVMNARRFCIIFQHNDLTGHGPSKNQFKTKSEFMTCSVKRRKKFWINLGDAIWHCLDNAYDTKLCK